MSLSIEQDPYVKKPESTMMNGSDSPPSSKPSEPKAPEPMETDEALKKKEVRYHHCIWVMKII